MIWAKGIDAPRLGNVTKGGDFRRSQAGQFVDYYTPFVPGKGWYDVDKRSGNDTDVNLCFAATAANMLHWWYDQNQQKIDHFLTKRDQNQPLDPTDVNTFKDARYFKNSFQSTK